MPDLIIQSRTAQDIDNFASTPSQVLIISGPRGAGKSALADLIAIRVLNLSAEEYDTYPYKLILGADLDDEFGIDSVRSIEHFLSLKIPSKQAYNRAIIVNRAEELAIEAQNALLKTLEEPPEGTLIILCASHTQSLLPTIRSRAVILSIHKPSKAEVEAFFKKQGVAADQFDQAYTVCGGLPGLISAVLANEDHELLSSTSYARQLLGGSQLDRLTRVDELAKNKDLALNVCFILQQMAHVSLESGSKNSGRWQRILKHSYEAQEALLKRVQPKLVLTNLMLSL